MALLLILLFNFTVTIQAVYYQYYCIFLNFITEWVYSKERIIFVSEFLLSLHWFLFYPAIVLGYFLIYWLPGSAYIEYLFAFFMHYFLL